LGRVLRHCGRGRGRALPAGGRNLRMIKGLSSRGVRAGMVAVVATALAASFGGAADAAPRGQKGKPTDAVSVGGNYNQGKPLALSRKLSEKAVGAEKPTNVVGTVRRWPALDDKLGVIYVKNYRLMGLGDNIEIWVAEDTQYPAGDCRNEIDGGAPTQVTQAQVDAFVGEFDENMYPKESAAFSVPPHRDGKTTALTRLYTQFFGVPSRSYQGDGDRIVALIDNVRDQNYYEPTAVDGRTYIAGFFYSVFNEMTNRNVMTIDTFDWKHRTGANPPDDSTTQEYIDCSNEILRPFGDPRPRTYEGTFAHEYQHLLEYYEDRNEVNWVNEGLSDWAQTLVGYVDPSLDPTDPDADGHIAAFLGFQAQNFGGPEQSMTRWEDQGAPEILADYGAAYTFMEYLWSHFGGDPFMTFLHRDNLNGLPGLDAALDNFGYTVSAEDVLHDWLASMALDAAIEDGATVVNGDPEALETSSLRARINWDTPQAYDTEGAPTNGADFVRLRDAGGAYVSASGAGELTFDGAESFLADPVEWTTDGGRLYSGQGDNLDRAIARQVTVPATGDRTMTLGLEWNTEETWDFAFVQVYDETAGKWVSLSNANTTSVADPQADPNVVANLPGFSGSSGGDTLQTFDLSTYAGQTIWVAVRYITDGAVVFPGVWLSSMSVGGVAVPDATTLSAWTSPTGAIPIPVHGWTVQLVGYNDSQASAVTLELDANNAVTVPNLVEALGFDATTVAVLATVDDPTELETHYAGYALTAGGVSQPGG
jgi:hypothetical protein